MAFVTKNGYDVEHASQLLVYENLFPEIQHINGKGVTDKYTPTEDVDDVTMIDVMRVLPVPPRFRQIGATNNGTWHNQNNEGGFKNATQSRHYTIPVDLIYDEGVPITSVQDYSNKIRLKDIVVGQLVKVAGMNINIITYAKQIEGFFRDNFSAPNATEEELAASVFGYTKAKKADEDGSCVDAFIQANAALSEGIPEIGAFIVPADARQAFVTTQLNAIMKRQYMSNASEAAAEILATGFINPFNQAEGTRINANTGLLGMYDGVGIFLLNNTILNFVWVALGVDKKAPALALLKQFRGMIVYGAGTCRGIVGPHIQANENTYFGGVYILPKLKVGVEVLSGKTIKVIIEGAWTKENIDTMKAAIKFTPIDGVKVKAEDVFAGSFNDGQSS